MIHFRRDITNELPVLHFLAVQFGPVFHSCILRPFVFSSASRVDPNERPNRRMALYMVSSAGLTSVRFPMLEIEGHN